MALFAVLAITSCEKEEKKTSESSHAKVNLRSTEAANFRISLANSWFCGYKVPCGATTMGLVKNNAVVTTNIDYAFYPGVTYSFYRRIAINGNDEIYQPIPGAQYYCTSASNTMANGYLNNITKILVFANVGSGGPSMSTNLIFNTTVNNLTNYPSGLGVSDFEIIMTGTYKGKPCGDVEPPCSDCNVD